jgi:hypothetical protein
VNIACPAELNGSWGWTYARTAALRNLEEIAAIEWLGVAINAWNRIATPNRYPVKP